MELRDPPPGNGLEVAETEATKSEPRGPEGCERVLSRSERSDGAGGSKGPSRGRNLFQCLFFVGTSGIPTVLSGVVFEVVALW